MRKLKLLSYWLVFLGFPLQSISAEYWALTGNKERTDGISVRATQGALLSLDLPNFSQALAIENKTITLPLPNGQFTRFTLTPVQIMPPKLAAKYPTIQTYTGYQVSNPQNKGRFDYTPAGFHAMFSIGEKRVYIDPVHSKRADNYISYYKRDSKVAAYNDVVESVIELSPIKVAAKAKQDNQPQSITTYRLAMAATGEYTLFHGGTVENGMAAIVTMVNRLNLIFLTELAVQFELVENNDQLVYADANTDPYENNDDDADKNTGNINDVIGADNYDIGHVVTTNAGGLAGLGSLCTSFKGLGITGLPNPTGDAFWVDYVAHELGHQFGADHIFNGTSDSCGGGGRDARSAYEPGGGNSIMGYAGICGEQNIATQGLDHYHSHSLDDMNNVILARSCGIKQALGNNTPAVNAGKDYVVPANTPFTLVGDASDIDNDVLTYQWQQFDLGAASNSRSDDMTDTGDGPLFRVFSPTSAPIRTFPAMSDVLADEVTYGEAYPTTDRKLNFRFIARDGRGGVSYDQMQLDVVNTGQSFSLISPNGRESWNDREQTIEWNSANTEQAPISCSHVDIHLSVNGGQSFQTLIIENTPNDGKQLVTIPNVQSDEGRIRISCRDNVFFNVSKNNFSLNASPIAIISQQNIEIKEETSITLTNDLFTFKGGTPTAFRLSEGDNYRVSDETITPELNFFGTLNVEVRAQIQGEFTPPFVATITVTSVNDLPEAMNDTLTVEQNSAVTTVDVLANDSDVETAEITLVEIEYAGAGNAEIVEDEIQYQPEANFSGQEIITYWIEDEQQARASAVLTITVNRTSNDSSEAELDEDNSPSDSSGGGVIDGLLLLMIIRVIFSAIPTRKVK